MYSSNELIFFKIDLRTSIGILIIFPPSCVNMFASLQSSIDWILCVLIDLFLYKLWNGRYQRGNKWSKKTFLCKCAKSTRFYVPFYLGVPTKTSKCFYLLLFAHLIESSIILKVGYSPKFAQKHIQKISTNNIIWYF